MRYRGDADVSIFLNLSEKFVREGSRVVNLLIVAVSTNKIKKFIPLVLYSRTCVGVEWLLVTRV